MLLGFKERFADSILDGTKIFTVRTERKITPKPGEPIKMYSGLRTKHTKFITDKFKFNGTQIVNISIQRKNKKSIHVEIEVDDRNLTAREIGKFVIMDGFIDQYDFAYYWINSIHGNVKASEFISLSAKKMIYHWTPFRF
jgi:hypothetical protein